MQVGRAAPESHPVDDHGAAPNYASKPRPMPPRSSLSVSDERLVMPECGFEIVDGKGRHSGPRRRTVRLTSGHRSRLAGMDACTKITNVTQRSSRARPKANVRAATKLGPQLRPEFLSTGGQAPVLTAVGLDQAFGP
jgi:hypothetical protein